ncbi:hypothetical protein [Croceicoccus gelatinilyticus]|uniref:hypothetical protein n=1 Tax=Croceicoccus gelatinilyticus TaxID=2835536 RepID=UPI001BCA91E2|nr:hypothetical protein [Croceicoccus gelatinilyticus]
MIILLAFFVAAFGIIKPFKKNWGRKHFAGLALALFVALAIAVPKPTPEEIAAREKAEAAEKAAEEVAEAERKLAEAEETTKAVLASSKEAIDGLVSYTRSDFPKTYEMVGADMFGKLSEYEPGAIYAAARSTKCDKPLYGMVSEKKSTKDHPVWFVDCANDNRFMITLPEAKEALALIESKKLTETDRKRDCTIDTIYSCNQSPYQKDANEIEIVTFCDQLVEQVLISDSDMDRWRYSMGDGDEVVVTRPFTAQNAFGANLKHRYRCVFDARKETVTSLQIEGPTGTSTII